MAGRALSLFPLFHPAAALRTDSVKQLLREDIHKLPALLAEHVEQAAEESGDVEQLGLFQ